MDKCKVCTVDTDVVFNIDFKATHVCESCATSIFLQQAEWYANQAQPIFKNSNKLAHFHDGTNFYIAQKEKYGCSLACMAMILNISYEDIRSVWPSEKEGAECGIGEYKWTSFLFKYGFVGHTEYACEAYAQRKRPSDEWIKPFAPVHIVSCITENGPHAIIWLNDGRVYDPNVGGVHSINDYNVQGVTGYWTLNNLQ